MKEFLQVLMLASLVAAAGCRQGDASNDATKDVDAKKKPRESGDVGSGSPSGRGNSGDLDRQLLSAKADVDLGALSPDEIVRALDAISVEEFAAAGDKVRGRIESLAVGLLDGPRAQPLEISLPRAGKFLTGDKYASAVRSAFSYQTRFGDPLETIQHLKTVKPGDAREKCFFTVFQKFPLDPTYAEPVAELVGEGLLPGDLEWLNRGLAIQAGRDGFAEFIQAVRERLSPSLAARFYQKSDDNSP